MRKLIKFTVFLIISLSFFKIFIYSNHDNHQVKFHIFSSPAYKYPGADARNIQLYSNCSGNGPECEKKKNEIKEEIKKNYNVVANIPKMNYPDIWKYIYSSFDRGGEESFILFWKINALFLFIAISIISLRFNLNYYGLILFSPVTLLVVERGNIEAITFSMLVLGLLLSNIRAYGFFIGLTTMLKVFPIVSYIIILNKEIREKISIGILFALPLIIWSLSGTQNYISNTTYGLGAAYGLLSIPKYYDFNMLMTIAYVLTFFILAFIIAKNVKTFDYGKCNEEFTKISLKERLIFLIFSSIFILTFLLFINWAYRLIFLIPVLLILTKIDSKLSNFLQMTLLILFWIPILPYGWYIINFVSMFVWILLISMIFLVKNEILKSNAS